MFLLKQILPAAVIAMVVAAGICGLALLWEKERARQALGPIALGLAYFAGHLFVAGWGSFPPKDTINWLPYFALVTAVMGALCGMLALKAPLRALIFALVSAGALRLLLKPKFQYGWSPGEGWAWVAVLACAMVLLALILDALVRRSATAFEVPAFFLIVCVGTFGALMISGSMLLGQLASVLTAAVFGSLLFSARKVALGRGIVPLFTLLIGALLLGGYFFAELPATSAVLLAFAPILALVPTGASNRFQAFGIRAVSMSVPVATALVLAFRSSPPLSY